MPLSELSNHDKLSALAWMLGGVLIASWLYGSWHALDSHSAPKALLGLLIPPYGLYLASEAKFGHPPPERIDLATPTGQIKAIAVWNNQCLRKQERRQRYGLSTNQYREFCRCAANSSMQIYLRTNAKGISPQSPQFKKQTIRGIRSCLSTAQYLPD